MTEPVLRPAWQAALVAFAITLAVGAAVGLIAALASGSIHRDLSTSVFLYGRAFAPFVVIVTVATYAIQRARRAPR
jgi:ABC-type dipeptide/oligopeptide/nickel transport system permease component